MPSTCDKYGTFVTTDNKAISANRWGSDDTLCIETVGADGFKVTSSALNKNGVAAYPSFYEGMWPRDDMITKNSKFPVKISDMQADLVSHLDWTKGSGTYNCAYDIWFSETRSTNHKLELMIWLYDTGISPAGSKVSSIPGFDVWSGTVGGVHVASYVATTTAPATSQVNISVFIRDLVSRGWLQNNDYLTSVQCGFELWRGGVGASITNYSVEYQSVDNGNGDDEGDGDVTVPVDDGTTVVSIKVRGEILDISTTTPPVDPPVDPPVVNKVPQNLAATITADDRIYLNWNDVQDAVSYKIYETASPNGIPSGPVTVSERYSGPFGSGDWRQFEYWVTAQFGDGSESAASTHVTIDYHVNDVPPGTGGGTWDGTLPAGTTQGTLEFKADLSVGIPNSKNYKNTDYNTEPHSLPWPPPIVDGPEGKRCVKFSLPGNDKRVEVEPNHRTFGSSGEAWFGFWFYLDSNFPLNANSWHVIWQLHGNDTTSPKLALQAHKGGMTVGDNGALTPLVKEHWYACVVKADFSNGRITVWLDDKKVIDNYNAGKSNPNYYLKVGSYQDTAIGRGTIYQAGHALGSGYGAVRPV